jgi:hypothetical protein
VPVAEKEAYDLLCSELEKCSILLDPATAQGKAFDWHFIIVFSGSGGKFDRRRSSEDASS